MAFSDRTLAEIYSAVALSEEQKNGICKKLEKLGFDTNPKYDEVRSDIIQTIKFGYPEGLIKFCQGIQSASPVDSYVTPMPWAMPGYDSDVIMAAGAFTLGSSIELSADAPLREPFAVWMQGGLNFHSAKAGVLLAAQKIRNTK